LSFKRKISSMASTPSEASIDSGSVTGGVESRGGHSAESAKVIAAWIYPTIRGLCNELGAPAAARHILAGVTTILTLPSPPSSNDRENQKDDKKDKKIPALIAAVYFFVRAMLSGCEISGEDYVLQRKELLSTLAKLREDEELGDELGEKAVEWEGWEKVSPKDVDIWLLEISNRGWLKLDWFEKIVEGAGLEVKDGNERLRLAEERRLAEEQEASNTQQPKLNSCLVRFPTHPNPSTQLTETLEKET
jgi:hypothetical protein